MVKVGLQEGRHNSWALFKSKVPPRPCRWSVRPELSLLRCSCPEPEVTLSVKRIWFLRQRLDFREEKWLPFEDWGDQRALPSQIHHHGCNWQRSHTDVKGCLLKAHSNSTFME